jgi:signal transduction histidine kinase
MSEVQLYEINQLKTEVIILANQMTTNILEVGKRLLAIREMIEHGQWNVWVEQNLPFSRRWANQYIRAYEEFGNSSSHLPAKKMFLLLDLPTGEREEFLATNPVEDMTTRELQQAIKENKALKNQIAELENRPPQIIEKERIVVPGDYEQAKGKFVELTHQLQQKELEIKQLEEQLKDSEDGLELKKQIEYLSKRKTDLSRQIQSATELSKLAVRLHDVLKQELAPIKFSRCMEQLDKSETAINNLVEVIDLVKEWLHEIERYLPDKDLNYIDGEVIT